MLSMNIQEWKKKVYLMQNLLNSSLSIGTGVGSRMKKVLEVVRDKSNWNSKKDNRIGRGVALLEAYNTVLATVVEVEVSDNYDVNILKVTAAVDAGQLIHTLIKLKLRLKVQLITD